MYNEPPSPTESKFSSFAIETKFRDLIKDAIFPMLSEVSTLTK